MYPDDLLLALKVEIHAPVVDPVSPVPGKGFTGDDTVLVTADLHDPALYKKFIQR